MLIRQEQARAIFTKAYLKAYQETRVVPSFGRSFFKTTTSAAKELHFQIERDNDETAVDVLRGTGANRNKFPYSSGKGYVPPFFFEGFTQTDLDRYDVPFGESEAATPVTISYVAKETAARFVKLRKKIERAKELMAMQALETGIVTMTNGDDIDFKRKVGSLLDLSANPWSTTTTDVEGQLIAIGDFLAENGNAQGNAINLMMSGTAFVALKKTDYFTDNANFNQITLTTIGMPQAAGNGGVYHGQISAGAYIFNVWTYDKTYKKDGTRYRYLNEKKIIAIPTEGYDFELAHAGVPAIMGKKGRDGQYIGSIKGEYYTRDYINVARTAHNFEISSAPLPILKSVDMVVTAQILA